MKFMPGPSSRHRNAPHQSQRSKISTISLVKLKQVLETRRPLVPTSRSLVWKGSPLGWEAGGQGNDVRRGAVTIAVGGRSVVWLSLGGGGGRGRGTRDGGEGRQSFAHQRQSSCGACVKPQQIQVQDRPCLCDIPMYECRETDAENRCTVELETLPDSGIMNVRSTLRFCPVRDL